MQSSGNLSVDDQDDEKILMASMYSNANSATHEEMPERSLCVRTSENIARFVGVNLTGWGLEYMVFHAGIIVTNPRLYQNMWRIATDYYVSPMGLIGRGLIWAERGVLAIAYREERPENLKEIAKTAACDLAALGLIGLAYWAGSDLNKHTQMLIEISFIDSFVVSGTSSVMRAGASKIAECSTGIHWKFWQKRTTPHPIIMDHLLASEKKDSPPTPVFSRLNPLNRQPPGDSSRNPDAIENLARRNVNSP